MDTTLPRELTLADFDYTLPDDLIAQQPAAFRSESRLLHVAGLQREHLRFTDIERLLEPGTLLVCNDTRVMKARLIGRKPTGGRVELLVERILTPTRALALVRTSHTVRPGARFLFGDETVAPPATGTTFAMPAGSSAAAPSFAIATAVTRHEDFFELEFDRDVASVLDELGHVPLPPYITHADDADDATRYQTVFARVPGAVAAPTAGLHFTEPLLDRLRARQIQIVSVTLHVGAGTFQPVRVNRVVDHRMHSERYSISSDTAAAINSARAAGRPVVAIGTTALRALESTATGHGANARVQPGDGETSLFVTPGFEFRIVDRLLTNFHLPRSTLLMLVSAFGGMEAIRAAYADAIAHRYRFFSYGDAMLLERA